MSYDCQSDFPWWHFDDPWDDQNTTPATLMTSGDNLWGSFWWTGDGPENNVTTSDNYSWWFLSPKSKVACLAVSSGCIVDTKTGSLLKVESMYRKTSDQQWWWLRRESPGPNKPEIIRKCPPWCVIWCVTGDLENAETKITLPKQTDWPVWFISITRRLETGRRCDSREPVDESFKTSKIQGGCSLSSLGEVE